MPEQLQLEKGDITRARLDAIVNAANEALLPGGGVCGAIHRAAGPLLWEECRRIGHCEPGQAVITQAYDLPARWVIHTVGPVWEGGPYGEDEVLAACYENSIALAAEHGVRSIGFPAISTGVYGFPLERAAPIAVAAVRRSLAALPADAQIEVAFFCFDDEAVHAYEQALQTSESSAP